MSTPLHDFAQDGSDVRCAQAGDRAAFDRLVGRYRGFVLAFAVLRTSDREEAEDLTQRILLKAWERLAELHDPAAFAAWLRSITANACRDWYRRRAVSPLFSPWDEQYGQASPSSPLHDVLRLESRRALCNALRAMSLENCLPLLLHVYGGYRYEEIAQLLELPLTTVEGRIYRARQQLRRLLAEDADVLFRTLSLRNRNIK